MAMTVCYAWCVLCVVYVVGVQSVSVGECWCVLVCHGKAPLRASYIPFLECTFKTSPCVPVPRRHVQGFQVATAQRRTQHNTATTTTTTHGDVSDSVKEREWEMENERWEKMRREERKEDERGEEKDDRWKRREKGEDERKKSREKRQQKIKLWTTIWEKTKDERENERGDEREDQGIERKWRKLKMQRDETRWKIFSEVFANPQLCHMNELKMFQKKTSRMNYSFHFTSSSEHDSSSIFGTRRSVSEGVSGGTVTETQCW